MFRSRNISGLRFAAFLSFIAPVIACAQSTSFLPGDRAIALAASTQNAPALARGGDKVLVVWADNRSNPYGFYEYETSMDIYGMRFDSNGNQLDPTPISIATFQGAQETPKVCWNGTNWLVVFSSTTLGGTGYYYQKGLSAVRISPAGEVLDAQPILLPGLKSDSGQHWDVGSDGNNWVVVCQGTSASNGVVAMRISPNGAALDSSNKLIIQAAWYGRFNFRLAFAGSVFMVVFDDLWVNGQNTTGYVRFDASLRLLDPAPVRILDHPASAFVSNGNAFYLVSMRQMPNGFMRVNGNRVNTSGQTLDGDGVDISAGFEPQYLWEPFLAWTGSEWRITWGSNSTLRMASVNTSGVVVNPGGMAVIGPLSGPIAATADGGLQTVWPLFQNNSFDVAGTHILQQGIALQSVDMGIGAPSQLRSDAATNGNGYMVVYRSANSANARVLAQPLDSAGNPLLQEPVVLISGINVNGPSYPNVVWTGSHYMAAWSDGGFVYAQRLLPNGTKVDANPFVVMSSSFGPSDLAVIGDTVLVLARKAYQGETIWVVGVRVRTSDGTVLDGTPLTLGGQYVATAPAVTVLGGRFLVVFHSNFTHDNPACETQGVFVPASGSAGPPFNIHGPFSTAGGNGIFEVGLASNGNVAMMVQSQELSSGVETDMLCRFIDANGVVSNYKNLTPWDGNQYRPRVSWDGRNFAIVYQEQRNRTTYWTLDQIDARSDLFGMRVAPDGTVIDPMGFVFSTSPIGETDPSVISSNFVSLITGSLMDNTAGLSSYRIAYSLFGSANNQYPVAVAAATPNGGNAPLNVSFSSAGSYDPDGTIASTFWEFGDGGTSNEANPIHVYTVGVPAIVRLTVTDNSGAKTVQDILVWPTTINKLPIAIGVATPWFGLSPLDVVFSADSSYDPDGFLGNILWKFGDDQSEYWGSTGYHTFNDRGIWPVDITVWDSMNASNTSRLYVVVGPSASYVPSQAVTTIGNNTGGTFADLAQSDDSYYIILPDFTTNRGAPTAQVDATFTGAQSNIQGFAIRVEASLTSNPQNISQKVYAFNWQTQIWDLIDNRPARIEDVPYEVAVESGASRYVDAITGTVKLRMNWTPGGSQAGNRWFAKIDQLRLTALYP